MFYVAQEVPRVKPWESQTLAQVGLICDTWHHAIEWESKLDG